MPTLHDVVTKGSVDRSVSLTILDATDGTPETGVLFNTAGINLWYWREGAAAVPLTEVTLASLTTTHTDGGFLHVADGQYRLDLPDAAFTAGANFVDFGGTVTGMVVIGGRVRLVDYQLEDAANLGLTTLSTLLSRIVGTLATGTHQPQSGDGFARLGVPTGASLSADLVTLQSDTDNLQTRLPAALVSGRMDAHVGSIVAGVLTAATFAAGAFDAVWSVTARLLTAGTNIVLAKGTGVTGFNDLSAAQVNAEADTALADAGLSATTLIGPLVTVVADGANTATTFKIDLGTLPTDGPMDAWLSFDLTTTTTALRGQVKRVASFNTTTDFITLASAYTVAPGGGDTARLVTR